MSKESSDISQAVGFVAVDGSVVPIKGIFKTVRPDFVEFTETFANKAVECRIGTFLGTTFNDHVD